jgi:phosphoenolpyruvate carboxykinase (GTP)
VWFYDSNEEYYNLIEEMQNDGTLVELDKESYPNCYLHRSDQNDVARTEHLTYICTKKESDSGPTNNWMASDEAKTKLDGLFRNCMKGRTMYVIPYLMGPENSSYSQVGIEITDSPYVVANMRIMTKTGKKALEQLEKLDKFVKGIHSIGDLSPDRRYICHFPEEDLIMSIGSGYGGNALLSKKCHSLRLASVMANKEGWLAEHMLIMGVENPDGEITYVTGAFPSASGKTNLAMLNPLGTQAGWKVWSLGDDIAWIHPRKDGKFWAINPESGLFGVAPGTNSKSNPNALSAVSRNTIFTNVALTSDNKPWWEGLSKNPPENMIDWKGQQWKEGDSKAAHPNSRFTAPIQQIPIISPRFNDPQGVPISAITFGARRAKLTPLVFESFNWIHGVFIGAAMGAETTFAAVGKVGVVRRDPMAMRPFCGYHIGDYLKHWIGMGTRVSNPPRIFHVNWFRTDTDGKFLWPGFSENIRVLKWITDRTKGKGAAKKTAIGYVPTEDGIDLDGLDILPTTLEELLQVDVEKWIPETKEIRKFFTEIGEKLPKELWNELNNLEARLES